MTNAEKIRSLTSNDDLAKFLTESFYAGLGLHYDLLLKCLCEWLSKPAEE